MHKPWRIGALFSLSGSTGLPESEHARGVQLAVAKLNRDGGIMGRQVEVVEHNPAGDLGAFREHAESLMTAENVSIIFGCHTSDTRKIVSRSVERRNGLLWYPASYEGFEYSPNILYAGPVANQLIFPLADYLVAEHGGRGYLAGCDYVFPRETNRVMRDLIDVRGGQIVGESYVPVVASRSDLQRIMFDIRRLEPDFVFSTLVGEAGQEFARMYQDSGLDLDGRRPIGSISLTESELWRIGPDRAEGIITAASYFSSLGIDENEAFLASFRTSFGDDVPASGWAAASYAQTLIFGAALELTQSAQADDLLQAVHGMTFDAPEGRVMIDPDNNHTWLTPRIGRANAKGAFDVLWSATELIQPDPYLANSPIAPRRNADSATMMGGY
ncbi:transporter substrate-binding domain-containing protein [Oricola indica]|uniref:transporter substrate-binding domain-containing protein n=1 Tax=Oricola indica TaxID=2872591 RepID=UPI001CBF8E10|nr:transporter substrate-binding domain-containing protein [Oricola indica]